MIGLSAFAVFYGLDWVATVPRTVRLTVQRFGAEKAPSAGSSPPISSAPRPPPSAPALSRTELMIYLPALYVGGVACVVAAALALTIGRPRAAVPAAAAAAE